MASRTSKRIRLVKCPKCLKILQEDEDVPVYQCGGCSAILQAKRRSIASNITPSAVETERTQANERRSEPQTNNVSSSSRQGMFLPSSGQEGTQANEPETNNVSSSSRQDKVLSSSGQEGTQANDPETNNVFSSSRQGTVLPSSGQEGTQGKEPETHNASSSSGRDTVLPSSGQEGTRGNEPETNNVSSSSRQGAVPLSSGQEGTRANEPETNNVSSSSGRGTVLPSSGQEWSRANKPETNNVSSSSRQGIVLPSSGQEGTRANEPETNNVSSSSTQDTVLPSSPGRSSGQEYENKGHNASMESMEKQLGELELCHGDETSEIQQQECSLGDSEKNKEEDKSGLESEMIMNTVVEAAGSGASSGRLSDHVVAARASNSSGNAEASPDASPIEEEQTKGDGYLENKTSSAYDGSESSCEEREHRLLDENEQLNALEEIRSGKFEMPRYPEEQGASSSSTLSEKRRNETTTYRERHQNKSLQLEGPGGRLAREERRRYVTEQLRPDIPFYPREPYTRVSSSYPSHDEFDRYSRAHSLLMPPYAGGMNYESVDYIYNNNIRARVWDQGGRFSGEMAGDRRNHAGWYSGQLHNSYSSYSASPQRPMEQPEYYQRWSNEIISDVEDHQRNRQAGGHHHELQNRRLNERQCVAKRHVRPTAGGAPFVSCYQCSENLQLPVDFLIFKRKHHLLKCGTCNTVLRFSLQSGTHLVPAVNTHDINANTSTNSSSESPTDKAPSKPEAEMLSSSVQDEDQPVTRGSPLHRLLGYSTVSQVFKASQRPPSV